MKIGKYVIVAIILILLLISPCSCPQPKTPPRRMQCDKRWRYEQASGNNLKEEFIKRYNSWGTYFINISTFHWFDALKWLSVRQMRELCVCFHLKTHPNQLEVKLYDNPEMKDSDYADYNYTTLKMGSRDKTLRMYSCSKYFDTGINLLSGCSNYGFSRKYDVYQVSESSSENEFIGVGREITL